MLKAHAHAQHASADVMAINAGIRGFLNCMTLIWHVVCGLGHASVFAALGSIERPNAVNRFT